MKNKIFSTIAAIAALAAMTGCKNESPFNMNPGEGQLNSGTLTVGYINKGKQTRAEVKVGDFTVNFVNTATNEIARSFKYSQMPEIVALPVGDYRAVAVYGDNAVAEWENPYYTGASSFSIEEAKVTEDVDPIECTLSNIKVTVKINDLGLGLLDDDVKVIVSAGAEGKLVYDASTNDQAGYFRYVDGSCTLIAEFTGHVDGVEVDQFVIYDDASEGNSYSLNFEIKRPDNMNPGNIVITESGITLDATVTVADETKVIDPNEPDDDIIEDDMRPYYPSTGDEPGTGEDPGKDPGTDKGNKPEIITITEGMEVGKPYTIGAGSTCIFKVTSETGITAFNIKIESDTLTDDELDGVGLAAELDLVNPGIYEDGLSGLGFPVGDEVLGQNECEFDISGFLGLLGILGPGDHKFHLTVRNEAGTTTGTIWLVTE